jgi:hypothetical protein
MQSQYGKEVRQFFILEGRGGGEIVMEEILAMRILNTSQNSTAVLAHPFNAVTTVISARARR